MEVTEKDVPRPKQRKTHTNQKKSLLTFKQLHTKKPDIPAPVCNTGATVPNQQTAQWPDGTVAFIPLHWQSKLMLSRPSGGKEQGS